MVADTMSTPAPTSLTATQWVICAVACLGFAFEVYEAAALPLILRPALVELGGLQPGSAEFNLWRALLFWVPAMAGGIFGLVGGYLTEPPGVPAADWPEVAMAQTPGRPSGPTTFAASVLA